MGEAIDRIISTLNSIHLGELDRIVRRLDEVRDVLQDLEKPELEDYVNKARAAIQGGDLPLFRKRIQHVVSRLGHLR